MVEPSCFEWRAALGSWRWLILGAIGAGAACGGKAGSEATSSEPDGQGDGGSSSGVNPVAMGGSAMASPLPERGGAAGLGGMAGGAGSGNLPPVAKPWVCTDETTLEDGLLSCSNGAVHRVSSSACTIAAPLPELISEVRFPGDAGQYACLHNADCTEQPLGQCAAGYGSPYCRYGCERDDECEVGQYCRCDGTIGVCEATGCRTDSDCTAGQLCARHTECGYTRFVCTTKYDQCLVDSDCPSGVSCSLAPLSEVNPLGSLGGEYRKCELRGCPVPGRPFLVSGEARLAPITARRDWYSALENERAPAPLPPELRAELARGWTEQALMEHASIAAFARFTLQLLSLGAPAELVARSSEAMGDELRHAQDCFRLARRYSSSELGPGPLAMAGALEATELADVVLSTLREGCIGETVAAIEAAEALQHCSDAEARPVLERIAAEETRHAELAWRFVAWALETTAEPRRTELRHRIREALAQELGAPVSASELAERDRELAQHGLLTPALRQALHARVLREVVAPCAEALLASAPPATVQQARLVHVDIERQRTAALEQPGVSARQVIAG